MTPPDPPVFAEPWQAQAFALAVALHERGLFTWSEWAEALGAELKGSRGDDYFHAWLDALEKLVVAKGAARGDELRDLAQAWIAAADSTPHGQPIVLRTRRSP